MTATVLLLEDEVALRSLVREILERQGYRVLEATSPEQAFRLAGESPVDLLLTDVVMPDMTGPQVASRLAEDHPGLKVLFMSGYTDEAVIRHGVANGTTAFLQKPFTFADLAAKLRDVLGA